MFPSFLRFSVRDLLWLTLVVSLFFGYYAQERQHNATIKQLCKDADHSPSWRVCAEALGKTLEGEGWIIEWDTERVNVRAIWKAGNAKPQPYFHSMETGVGAD